MPRKKKGPGRGGKRPGAGRKRELSKAVKLTIALEAEQVAWVDGEVEAGRGSSRAQVVRQAVDTARSRE